MRVLHVNKFLYRRGGAEGYMLDVAALQREAGHEVELWGMHHPENESGLPLEATFAPHIELEPPPGGAAAVGAAARMIWSPVSRRNLAAALDQFRPDVIHCHNIYHQLSPSILRAAKSAGVPVVMTLHDYKLACPSYQMLDHGTLCSDCVGKSTVAAVRRRCKSGSLGASSLLALESAIHRLTDAYAGVDRLICPSRFLAGVMVQAGIAQDRLRIVPHFVLEDPTATVRDERSGVVFGGRLAPEKGIDTLIRAAVLVPDVRVDIAGDGPERAALERLASSLGATNVRFHGRLARSELLRLTSTSVAMIVPSRWHENQPMTILESYAVAVPAIVTSLGGMPELVQDGVDGLVVAHDDPTALAAAILELTGDPARAARMGRVGRDRLQDVHSVERHLAALDGVYDELRVASVGGVR